jgi:hypothetical protein
LNAFVVSDTGVNGFEKTAETTIEKLCKREEEVNGDLGPPYASIHRTQYLIKYPIEMCSFWRVIFQVIEDVCNFLKQSIRGF